MNTLLTTRVYGHYEDSQVLINLDTVRHFEEREEDGLTKVYFTSGEHITVREYFSNIVEMLHDND